MSVKKIVSKRTKILFSAAIILAAICALQFLLELRSPQKTFKTKELPDSILVDNSGASLVLQKDEGGWTCSGQKLDGDKIERLTKSLLSIKSLSVASRSDSPASLERYGLDKAILIEAKSGGKDIRQILVGKESVSGSQSYIQFKGKKEIYLVQGNFRKDWTFTLDDIKEKQENN